VPVKLSGYFFIIGAACLWGLSGTVAKYLFNQEVSPVTLVQVRMTLAAILLGTVLCTRQGGVLKVARTDWPRFIILGMAGMAWVQFTYLYTISQLNVATAVFLQYLAPILIAVYTVLFLRQPLGTTTAVSLAMAVAGSAMIMVGQVQDTLTIPWRGLVSGLASAVAMAFYTLYGQTLVKRYNPWTVLFYALVFGAIPWWVWQPPWVLAQMDFNRLTWAFFMYIGIFATMLPFGLYFMGLGRLAASRASIVSTLEPVVAGVTAYLILGEIMSPVQLAGGMLIVAAIISLQMERAPSFPGQNSSTSGS